MNQETFFENFELLADAPNEVQKLRELILEMAVQGKLLPQNLNDEPASELLKLIAKERENAILTKIIRRPQSLPSLVEEELPFDAPSGWTFEQFGNLFNFIDYRGKTPEKVESGIRLITAKNIRMGYRQDQPMEFVTEKTHNEWMTRGIPEMGDLLFTTEAPMGNVCLVDLDEKFALAQRTINLHPFGEMNSQYLMFAIMSPLIQGMISEKATGMTATGIKAAKLKLIPIPLPPLNEQKRIVAKVDQLMALCDELEARQQKKHEQRICLNNAVLDKLLTAPTPEEFAQYWQRISDNFDLLYDVPETVGQLRQGILQLAVQGKLVAQDPNNKSASQLINDIIEERKKWYENECEIAINIGSKKPKKPKLTSIEFPEELDIPRIPESWQFCLFEDIAASKENAIKAGPFGSALTKNCYVPSGYKIYGQEQVINGDASYGDYYIDDTKFSKLKSCEVAPGDILISLVGTIGKVLILPNDCESGIINPRLVKLSLNAKINQRFIEIYLNSPLTKDFLSNVAHGGTMNILNLKILKNLPVPIPPTEEQAQIVAKVDQLMALCDELEAGLVQAQTKGGELMEAVVHHVLAG